MGGDRISMRQLLVLLFTALLSPAIQVLPRRSAALAGEAGWLSALVALPAALAVGWVLFRLLSAAGPGEGLAEVFRRVLGKVAGKALALLYLLWGLLALAVHLRGAGRRFLSAAGPDGSRWAFVVILGAVVLWLARGKLAAFARAGEIFYLILALALGVVLFFALFHLRPENLLPLWVRDLPAAALGAVPALDVLSWGVFGAFLAGRVRPGPEDRARAFCWTAAFCLVLTALQCITLGNFGPALTAEMETPFFTLAKGIGVQGGFQRVEALVVALWLLADLAMGGVLAFACRALVKSVFPIKEEGRAAWPVVALGAAGALLLFPDGLALERFADTLLTAADLALGFLLPALVLLIARLRRRS